MVTAHFSYYVIQIKILDLIIILYLYFWCEVNFFYFILEGVAGDVEKHIIFLCGSCRLL